MCCAVGNIFCYWVKKFTKMNLSVFSSVVDVLKSEPWQCFEDLEDPQTEEACRGTT